VYWIWQFIVEHRNFASLTFTVFLSLFMISADEQKQQNIARTLTLSIFSPAQLAVGTFYQFHNIFDENKELREKIVRIELENAKIRKKLKAVGEVGEITEDVSQIYEIVPADIVAREPSFFYKTAIINAGANQGIKNLMPVISTDGVVGKVISVLPFTSQIQMIYEPEEYVSIEHEKSGTMGILYSKSDGTLFADVRSVTIIEIGDTLTTTGLGGIYPAGLTVGTTKKIDRTKGGEISKRIYINPVVDFEKLRKVYVIKSEPKWEAIRDEIIQFGENKKDGIN